MCPEMLASEGGCFFSLANPLNLDVGHSVEWSHDPPCADHAAGAGFGWRASYLESAESPVSRGRMILSIESTNRFHLLRFRGSLGLPIWLGLGCPHTLCEFLPWIGLSAVCGVSAPKSTRETGTPLRRHRTAFLRLQTGQKCPAGAMPEA